MNNGTLHHDGTEHADHGEGIAGALAAASLRAIDGGMHALQRLRDRIEVPDDEAADSRDDRRRGRDGFAAEQPVAKAAGASRTGSLLHSALVVLMCLLLGGVVGMLFSYRGFSKLLDSREAMIESMQDEIVQAKKEEALDLDAKARYQMELGEYRKQLRESQYSVDEYKSRVEDLNNQLLAMQRVNQPAPRDSRAAQASARQPAPQKTGTCVTGATNLTGKLADCIDKFNRP